MAKKPHNNLEGDLNKKTNKKFTPVVKTDCERLCLGEMGCGTV